jgi:hypothetical protein
VEVAASIVAMSASAKRRRRRRRKRPNVAPKERRATGRDVVRPRARAARAARRVNSSAGDIMNLEFRVNECIVPIC